MIDACMCSASVPVCFSPELVSHINVFANDAHFAVIAIVMTAFQLLLSRYSRHEDIVVGIPMLGR